MKELKNFDNNTDKGLEDLESGNRITFLQAKERKEEQIWRSLFSITVKEAVEAWFKVLINEKTLRTYSTAMNELFKRNFLHPDLNLQEFSLLNTNSVVDQIKTTPLYYDKIRNGKIIRRLISEGTKQTYAAAFISFTGFLSRRTNGVIRKAIPNNEGINKTFYKIRDTVKTNAFQDRSDWESFFRELFRINKRDALIAKIMLQGGKRISEVLSLQIDAIDFARGEITFKQSKKKGTESITIITYRQEIMNELKQYIGERQGTVFITKTGKSVHVKQIERNFLKAGKKAFIPFPVTPHVLRATAVTHFKAKLLSDSDIMKVTGHANSQMIAMYDKSSKAENASKKINLV